MNNRKEQWVKAIKVNGVPDGSVGIIKDMDMNGKFLVQWESGNESVIRERGDSYIFINMPQKSFWNFKNLLLILRNKLKQTYYGD